MGILKNARKIFNRYQNRFLSLKYRFVDSNTEAEEFLNMVNRQDERNFIQSLMHPIEALKVGCSKRDMISNYIFCFIKDFTNHAEIDDFYVEKFKNYIVERFDKIESIVYEDRDYCIINFIDGENFSFQTFTSVFDDAIEMWPDLLSSERNGRCHNRSLCIAVRINAAKVECVTGVVYPFISGAKYLHSWVEILDDDGNVYCIDNNLNAVMSKDDYYKLMHARPFERIDKNEIFQDRDAVNYFIENSCVETPYIKLYCASRDEGLEKYNEILNEGK